MKTILLCLMLLIVLGSGCTPSKESAVVVSSVSQMADHEGALVKFEAQRAPFAEQHPTGLLNSFDSKTGEMLQKSESYVTLGDESMQIVLASAETILCDRMEIEGIVHLMTLGGEPATKMSYERVWIDVTAHRCL